MKSLLLTARTCARTYTTRSVSESKNILHGEPILVNKSKFIAHCAEIQTDQDFKTIMSTLLQDKKIQNATHNIYAYRIKQGDDIIEYSNDDGETGASEHLLSLLRKSNVHNICVIVTRWYGGVKLGSERFRVITNCAQTLLQTHSFIKRKSSK
jgi:putative IMPACT (imprinted ancient) family translation regulator